MMWYVLFMFYCSGLVFACWCRAGVRSYFVGCLLTKKKGVAQKLLYMFTMFAHKSLGHLLIRFSVLFIDF